MRTYKPKELIEGRILGLPLGKYVAVPKQRIINGGVEVSYNQEKMIIGVTTPHLMSRSFPDKFYPNKSYTLLYYKWMPNVMTLAI